MTRRAFWYQQPAILQAIRTPQGFQGDSGGKEFTLQCSRWGFGPRLGKIPQRRKWQPTPVLVSSVTQSCPTLCNPMDCSTPGFPVHHQSWSLLKLMSIESMMSSSHLILCRPLLLLPSNFLSVRVFSSESVLHITWPKGCSFSFSISPSNEFSGLISFRMDWLDLLAVQGTLKTLLQPPVQYSCLENPHGPRSLVGYSP